MHSESLQLPWEVIEHVIVYSAHHPRTLRSLALTCRQLLPRTRLVMFTRVSFENSAQVFTFITFLHQNPHLKPIVHTVVFSPASFGPSLLHILPNLSSIEYVSDGRFQVPALPSHHIGLACFRSLGTHIQTLRLSKLSFPTLLAFAQLLLAIQSTTHLVCEGLQIEAACDAARLNAIKARMCTEMQLTTITIDYESLDWTPSQRYQFQNRKGLSVNGATNLNVHVGELLFHPKSAVQSLSLRGIIDVSLTKFLAYDCDWSKLQSLVLQLMPRGLARHHGVPVEGVLKLLENFPKGPSLQEVTLEWQLQSLSRLVDAIPLGDAKVDSELEDAMLKFSQPRLVFAISERSANSPSCWARELEKYFSTLSLRKAVELTYTQRFPTGHDYAVQALIVSPDSKWVASGSKDPTIILWDASSGAMVQQWVAHCCKSVRALAFSPDSRFLLSGGEDCKVVIWDLTQGARKVATLEGHAGVISTCAWSSDGKTLATGSDDGTMWLWDAHTFRPLTLHKLKRKARVRSLVFSPDGRWLACVSETGECRIVNVVLDMPLPDMPLGSDSPSDSKYTPMPPRRPVSLSYPVANAAFDSRSKYLVVGLYRWRSCLHLVDPKTGKTILQWEREGMQPVYDISFSPDGPLAAVLGAAGRTVHIWEAFRGFKRFRLRGHEEEITEARFSPCGEYVGIISSDKTVQLWRKRDLACVARLSEHTHQVHHLTFSPNGKTLSSGDNHGRVVIQRIEGIIPPTWDSQGDH